MRRAALSSLVLLSVSACRSAFLEANPARRSAPRVLTLDEVQAKLGQPGVYVYDANPRELYEQKHVPGARWIQWDHVTARDLPPSRDATLVFYCALEQCSASHESAVAALSLGYPNVYVMPQGILGWKKAGKPVESGFSPTVR